MHTTLRYIHCYRCLGNFSNTGSRTDGIGYALFGLILGWWFCLFRLLLVSGINGWVLLLRSFCGRFGFRPGLLCRNCRRRCCAGSCKYCDACSNELYPNNNYNYYTQ